jgi:hypothetical protein
MRIVSLLVAVAVFGCCDASEAKEPPKIVPGSCHIVDKKRMCKFTNGEEREVAFHTVVVTPSYGYASQPQTQCYLTDPTTGNSYAGCAWQGTGPCQCADESGQVFYGTAQ